MAILQLANVQVTLVRDATVAVDFRGLIRRLNMITNRDAVVAAIAACATLCAVAVAQDSRPVLESTVFHWDSLKAKPTDVGALRDVVREKTATLEELEMHITTLNPGVTSHAPHRHPNEELVIVREGTLEAFVNGRTERVGPGSIIFNASNQLHGVRNVGDGPATYHVINWKR
jgi:quercetin dioxygenase-like cupin family protein